MYCTSGSNKKSSVHSLNMKSEKAITFRRLQSTPDTALVWGALALTMRVSRFFGTAPLKFQRKRNFWCISLSPAMCVYSYVFIIVVNIMVLAAIVMDASVPAEESIRFNSKIDLTVWLMDMVIVAVISVYGVVNGPSQMKELVVYLNQIRMIFTNLKYECIMKKPEKLKCCYIILYVFGAIFVCTWSIVSENDAVKSNNSMTTFWLYTFSYVQMLMLCLLELQFILSAMLSHTLFQCVNEELTALVNEIDSKTTSNYNRVASLRSRFLSSNSGDSIPPSAINLIIDSVAMMDNSLFSDSLPQCWNEKIRHLCLAYGSICDEVRRIDKSNGMLNLLLLLSYLIHMVVTPYHLITSILEDQDELVLQVFWFIFHSFKMMMIVEPGHRMQQEIVRTQVLVGQLMNRASSPRDPIMDELNIFNKQITLDPVVFTALGICTLSRPLIASILGAVTTYLVILIQFQKSGP